jgi:hypothetical protein
MRRRLEWRAERVISRQHPRPAPPKGGRTGPCAGARSRAPTTARFHQQRASGGRQSVEAGWICPRRCCPPTMLFRLCRRIGVGFQIEVFGRGGYRKGNERQYSYRQEGKPGNRNRADERGGAVGEAVGPRRFSSIRENSGRAGAARLCLGGSREVVVGCRRTAEANALRADSHADNWITSVVPGWGRRHRAVRQHGKNGVSAVPQRAESKQMRRMWP